MAVRPFFSLLAVFAFLAPVATCVAAIPVGTGFFVTADGYFITCYHVVDGARSIALKDINGNLVVATVIAGDRSNDIAVLKANGKFSPLPIGSVANVRRGTSVLTMGFPNLDIQGTEPKLTNGIVSSLSGIADDPTAFQVTVPVQPGNSGGPLVAADGNVIGVITAKLDAIRVLQATGDIAQNVSYAVKASYVVALLGSIPGIKLAAVSKRRFNDIPELAPIVERAIALILVDTNRAIDEVRAKEKERAEHARLAREKEERTRIEAANRIEGDRARQAEINRLQTQISSLAQIENSLYQQVVLTQQQIANYRYNPTSLIAVSEITQLQNRLASLQGQLSKASALKVEAIRQLNDAQSR